MLPAFERIESITSGLEKSVKTGDRVNAYRLCFVLLRLIIEHHKTLEQRTKQIEVLNARLASMPTKLVHNEYYSRSGRRWGRSSNSYVVGTSGDRLRPIDVDKSYHAVLTQSVTLSFAYNEELLLLKQYAEQFNRLRSIVIDMKPNNMQQRQIQLILARSQVMATWYKDSIDENPVLSCICGRFYEQANLVRISHEVLKGLSDRKSNVGRFSFSAANRLVYNWRHDHYKRQHERYIGIRSGKDTRCDRVQNYVKNSPRYQQLLSWIVGLENVRQAISIARYAAEWKLKYAATDRLCRNVAIRKDSYVKTLFTSQPVQCGTVRHLETDIPVYVASCIIWENRPDNTVKCYYLGRTGSETIDNAVRPVEWYHQTIIPINADDEIRLQRAAVEYLRTRLGYTPNQKVTQEQRRKEIAAYARKLVWLESISMLDSKAAGNCLPGTLQFCKTLAIDVPSDWSDVKADTRKLLRAWKQNGYGVNRLLLPAIDSAVDRVKRELLSVTACYVPSVVK